MLELVEANWPIFAILLVLAILILLWVILGSRKAKVTIEEKDPDATGPRRNQALIDAPPVAAATAPATMSKANDHALAKAPASTDAEAGPQVMPTTAPPPELAGDAAPAQDGDDLSRIKGVGPKLVAQLHALDVTGFAQIAAWDEAEIDRIDAQLGRFQGRIRRDRWVQQAQLLASGDIDRFEDEFGRT